MSEGYWFSLPTIVNMSSYIHFPVFTEEFKVQFTATATYEHPNEESDYEAGTNSNDLKCWTRRSLEARKQLEKCWNVRAITKETLDFIQFSNHKKQTLKSK